MDPKSQLKGLPVNLYTWNPDIEDWEKLQTTYEYSDYELSDTFIDGDTSYYGYVDQDENWKIEKIIETIDSHSVRFTKGSGDYVANFAVCTELDYYYYFEIDW